MADINPTAPGSMDATTALDSIDTASGSFNFTDPSFWLTYVGVPFIVGLAVGIAFKKLLKWVLILGGIALIGIFVLDHYGISNLDQDKLVTMIQPANGWIAGSLGFLKDRISQFGGKGFGALAGFVVGYRMG